MNIYSFDFRLRMSKKIDQFTEQQLDTARAEISQAYGCEYKNNNFDLLSEIFDIYSDLGLSHKFDSATPEKMIEAINYYRNQA